MQDGFLNNGVIKIMKIDKTIQTEKGAVYFNGELNEKELDFVIEVGLNFLLAQGAIPLSLSTQDEASSNS